MIYPTQQLAGKYLQSGYQQLMRQHPGWQVFYKREGPLVVMVLESTDPEIASSFLDRVSYVSSVSWDPKAEPLSVGHMMLSVFLYVGAVIAITMVAGLLFGLLRLVISWPLSGEDLRPRGDLRGHSPETAPATMTQARSPLVVGGQDRAVRP